MKLCVLIILLFAFLIAGCGRSAPSAKKDVNLNSPEMKARRVSLVEQIKPQFAKDGIAISLEDENKNVLKLESETVSIEEMKIRLNGSLESFTSAGIKRAVISHSPGVLVTELDD